MIDVYWLEQSEADMPPCTDWLHVNESAMLETMRFPKRRLEWQLGRWTAKRALASYYQLPLDAALLSNIEIRAAASGAPEVVLSGRPAPFKISISHRAGKAICAVIRLGAAIGCDIELIEPRSDQFVADYFTAAEQDLVARTAEADRARVAVLLWSAKESVLKALHAGLRADTRSVSVVPSLDFVQSDSWRPLRVRCADNQSFHGWWQQSGEYLRTVVAAPPPGLPTLLTSRQ